MDIAELLEKEKQKEAEAEEERLRRKIDHQLKTLYTEKHKWTKKTRFDINRQRLSLRWLENEKDTEIEKYLATQSVTTENKYRLQKQVVKDLVKTTDVVKTLLETEKETSIELKKQSTQIAKKTMEVKREWMKRKWEDDMFRMPDEHKMNKRVSLAGFKFDNQLLKNKILEEKIDELIFVRKCDQKEQEKLHKELIELDGKVLQTMTEISDLSEQRDRTENTHVKVKDHLQKVKDRFQRELIELTLIIGDSKNTETFMKTKHKDITQLLIQQRAESLEKVQAMLAQTDEFQLAFHSIRQATGEEDMIKNVKTFLEQEDANFAAFLRINEVSAENEKLQNQLSEIRGENVQLETSGLDFMTQRVQNIKELGAQIASYGKKSELCIKRLKENGDRLDEFMEYLRDILATLQVHPADLKEAMGSTEKISESNVLPCMSVIEHNVTELLYNYYMLEMSVRAKVPKGPDMTEDEQMLTRVPSHRIDVSDRERASVFSDFKSNRLFGGRKTSTHGSTSTVPQKPTELREIVVKNMLGEKP